MALEAVATVDATYQGVGFKAVSGALVAWQSQVRDATTASIIQTYSTNTSKTTAVLTEFITSRGGYRGGCNRTFLFFDGLDTATGGGTITGATLKVLGGGGFNSTVDTIIVEGTAWGGNGSSSTLAGADYSNLDHSTAYSSKKLSWNTLTYNDFTLNSTAIADMNTNGYLNAVLIEGDYDYDNESPSVGTITSACVGFFDFNDKIKLDLSYTIGYGNDVIGVSAATISKVIGVSTVDIVNINGVNDF